jgi:hypothetical protein
MAAVESVVVSGCPDVAVVVSDNSTDRRERERLRELCASRGQPIEYVTPPEPLPMAAHWQWLWKTIERTVQPTHVTYLTDREVFAAGALRELLDVAASRPESVVSYQWDHVHDEATPVELVQSQWTGELLELDSEKLVELSSRGVFGDYIPRLMNSIAPAPVMARIEERFGDVFGSISPDFRFAYRCLAVCDAILYLDRSCAIEYGMSRSNGGNVRLGRVNSDAADFARNITGPRFGATPEPALHTLANAIFQEYFSVRAELGTTGFPLPCRQSYLGANAMSVDRMVEPEARATMARLLRQRGWTRSRNARRSAAVAAQIGAYFLRHPGAFARSVRRQLWDRPPGTPAARLLPKLGLDPRVRDELRFDDAVEAIAYANAHPRPPMPYAWHVHQLERAGAVVRRVARLPSRRRGTDRHHPDAQPVRDRQRDAGSARVPGP